MSGADDDVFAQLRGFAQRGAAAQRAVNAAGAGVPGKRTQIEQLGAQVHGEMSEACDVSGADCFLDDRDRGRLEAQITAEALGAAQKWGQALTDARLVKLCSHESGWGALWEIAFDLAKPALAGGAVDGVLHLLSSAARSTWEVRALAPIVNSDPVRKELADAFAAATGQLSLPGEAGAAHEAAFLTTLQNAPVDWAMALIRRARTLGDVGLIALANAIDPTTVLTFERFARAIAELLARWSAQVDLVGMRDQRDPSEWESCAWITPRDGGEPRLARVLRAPVGSRMLAIAFRGWIDDDMRAMAIAQWEAAFPGEGIEVVTLDRLADVPSEARAWERLSAASGPDEDIEPRREASHEVRP